MFTTIRRRLPLGLMAGVGALLCVAILLSPTLIQPCVAGRPHLTSVHSHAIASKALVQRRELHGGVPDGHDDDAATTGAEAPAPEGTSTDSQTSNLTANKVGALAVLLVVPLLGCFLPWVLPIPLWILNYAVLFSAGLFFSLALEHLLADSASAFGYLVDNPYPFAYMIFVSGYFLTWLADITARAVWDRQEGLRHQKRVDSKAGPADAIAATAPLAATPSGRVVCCKSGRTEDSEVLKGAGSNGSSNGASKAQEAAVPAGRCPGGECKCDGGACKCTTPSFMEFDSPEAIGKAAGTSLYDLNFMEVLLLLLALCFHAVFEGLAVGLSTTPQAVWSTLTTVVIHKFLEGIALGTTLLAQNRQRSIWIFLLYALAFSIMCPIGIAIGIILDSSSTPEVALWVEAIGNALAAGVFVFVAVGHLMVKAMKPGQGDKWWAPFPKWGFAALGVITNSLLMMMAD